MFNLGRGYHPQKMGRRKPRLVGRVLGAFWVQYSFFWAVLGMLQQPLELSARYCSDRQGREPGAA